MDQVLIIGVDTLAGKSLAHRLADHCKVSALWLNSPEHIDRCTCSKVDHVTLTEHSAADVVIFCGGGSRSSWDADFGDFQPEKQWLDICLNAEATAGTRFVYVSSDAVFGGPWVFHNDDSQSYSESKIARQLRQFESVVQSTAGALIIRTNVAGLDRNGNSFASRFLNRMSAGESEHIESGVYATPLTATDFAEAVDRCLGAGLLGFVNIAGAERTSPYQFATALAAAAGYGMEHLMPTVCPMVLQERSLRCERLRHDLSFATPILKQTVEQLSEDIVESFRAAA